MTAILEPPTATATGSPAPAPAPALRPRPVLPPVIPPAAPTAEPAARGPREKRVLTPTGVRMLGAVLVGLFAVEQLLYPTVDGELPPLTAVQEVVVTVMTLLMLGTLAGFLSGRRWALPAAVAFSAAEAVNVGLCPVTGHHVLGWWWYVQVAVTVAMVVLPAVVLGRTRAG